ncbi:MAG TPA: tol-pal system protein YbgF [Kofleriaceae bacterium]|nr:tol-pal system protein YbgF [Kofleriaceae bacterium]
MKTVLALLLAVGCASPLAAVKEDNRRLAQTVAELRAERRAQERRLRDLQRQLDLARAQLVTRGADGAVPELRVEVIAPAPAPAGAPPPGPEAPRVVGVADDGAEIVYEGDAAAGKQATLAAVPPRPASRPARAPARTRDLPTGRGGNAGAAYRAAVELVKAGSHAEGAAALRAFLAKHPRHDFADNAQYWLGEAFYAQKDYANALTEFRSVIDTYPRGNKVPDALLKVGYCYLALGQTERSRAVLEQVVNLYPKTEPAATAARRLESL